MTDGDKLIFVRDEKLQIFRAFTVDWGSEGKCSPGHDIDSSLTSSKLINQIEWFNKSDARDKPFPSANDTISRQQFWLRCGKATTAKFIKSKCESLLRLPCLVLRYPVIQE